MKKVLWFAGALGLFAATAVAEEPTVVSGKTAKEIIIYRRDGGNYTPAAALPKGALSTVLYGVPLSTPSVIQVKVQPGYVIPWHHHPLDELITLIKGSVRIDVKGEKPRMIEVGGLMVMPSGQPHQATCVGKSECVLRLHPPGPWQVVYENPLDDPRRTAKRR